MLKTIETVLFAGFLGFTFVFVFAVIYSFSNLIDDAEESNDKFDFWFNIATHSFEGMILLLILLGLIISANI